MLIRQCCVACQCERCCRNKEMPEYRLTPFLFWFYVIVNISEGYFFKAVNVYLCVKHSCGQNGENWGVVRWQQHPEHLGVRSCISNLDKFSNCLNLYIISCEKQALLARWFYSFFSPFHFYHLILALYSTSSIYSHFWCLHLCFFHALLFS